MGQTRATGYHWTRERWSVRAGEWVLYALAYGFRVATWPIGVWTLGGALAPLGGLVARMVPGFRRRAEENLALVWPERSAAERRRVLRDAGRSFLRLMVEYAHIDRVARRAELEVEGLAQLEAARAVGRGALIVTAHYGNWEAIRIAAARAGIECGILYRPFNNRYLNRFTHRLIGGIGMPVLEKGPAGLRECIAHLRRGGVLLVLVDQRNSGAPFLPFLGQPAETMTVSAAIAAKCGAALIPAVARRHAARRRFSVRFEPEIATADPEAAMRRVNERIGAWIEEEPGQWFWFHRRWRATRRSRQP
jgi:KDO2-lipid IV(A) lauroyltransferase